MSRFHPLRTSRFAFCRSDLFGENSRSARAGTLPSGLGPFRRTDRPMPARTGRGTAAQFAIRTISFGLFLPPASRACALELETWAWKQNRALPTAVPRPSSEPFIFVRGIIPSIELRRRGLFALWVVFFRLAPSALDDLTCGDGHEPAVRVVAERHPMPSASRFLSSSSVTSIKRRVASGE